MDSLRSWYASAQMGGKISVWTLRFHQDEIEKAFLASRADNLVRNFRLGVILASIWICGFIIGVALDWSTSGAYFVASERSYKPAVGRNVVAIVGVFLCIGALACTCSPIRSRLGLLHFEQMVVLVVTSACIFIIAANPGFLAHVFHEDPEIVVNQDMGTTVLETVLYLDVLTAGAHMLFPVRWCLLCVQEVVPLVGYSVSAFAFKGRVPMSSILLYVFLLFTLNVCAGCGKRILEFHERAAFIQMAAEKTRRYEAEHRLESLERSMKPIGGRTAQQTDNDVLSNAATNVTAEVFRGVERAEIEHSIGEFHALADLGFREHWLIQAEDLTATLHDLLGSGGFGVVMRANYLGAPVAVKTTRCSKKTTLQRSFAALASELRIFRRLHHPNIVVFVGACILPQKAELVLVLEHVLGCPLRAFIKPPPAMPSLQDRFAVATAIASALMYLHAQRPQIVHGDVKDSNIMVETCAGTVRAKLLDFGLSRLVTGRPQRCGGTIHWMAPEVLTGQSDEAIPSVDTFSFGRLLFNIMTGLQPLTGMPEESIISAAKAGRPQPLPWGDHVPLTKLLRRVSESCMRSEPSQRSSMVQVHASLQGLCPRGQGPSMLTIEEALEKTTAPTPQQNSACGDRSHDALDWGDARADTLTSCARSASSQGLPSNSEGRLQGIPEVTDRRVSL